MVGALEKDIGVLPPLIGRNSDVAFQAVAGGKINLRTYNSQVGEVMAYVDAINKLPLPPWSAC